MNSIMLFIALIALPLMSMDSLVSEDDTLGIDQSYKKSLKKPFDITPENLNKIVGKVHNLMSNDESAFPRVLVKGRTIDNESALKDINDYTQEMKMNVLFLNITPPCESSGYALQVAFFKDMVCAHSAAVLIGKAYPELFKEISDTLSESFETLKKEVKVASVSQGYFIHYDKTRFAIDKESIQKFKLLYTLLDRIK